jgi:hypothetical protein
MLATAGGAAAHDLFVNNLAGDDLFDGRWPDGRGAGSGPVKTLRQAIWLADTGDQITLANTGVPYHESVTLFGDRNSGGAVKPFTIDGSGAVLDGTVAIPDDEWHFDHGNVFRYRPERMAYQQLYIGGKPAVRRVAGADGAVPDLKPLEWALVAGQIYFCPEPTKMPQAYQARCAGLTVGITLYKVQNVSITNLIVQGYQLDGINLQDAREPISLTQLTARGNGRSGIAVCGASGATIEACLAGGNGESQLHIEGPSHTQIISCDLLSDTGPKWLKAKDSSLLLNNQPQPKVQSAGRGSN